MHLFCHLTDGSLNFKTCVFTESSLSVYLFLLLNLCLALQRLQLLAVFDGEVFGVELLQFPAAEDQEEGRSESVSRAEHPEHVPPGVEGLVAFSHDGDHLGGHPSSDRGQCVGQAEDGTREVGGDVQGVGEVSRSDCAIEEERRGEDEDGKRPVVAVDSLHAHEETGKDERKRGEDLSRGSGGKPSRSSQSVGQPAGHYCHGIFA